MWEYEVVEGFVGGKNTPEFTSTLNARGAAGWEAVGLHRNGNVVTVLLKRQKP